MDIHFIGPRVVEHAEYIKGRSHCKKCNWSDNNGVTRKRSNTITVSLNCISLISLKSFHWVFVSLFVDHGLFLTPLPVTTELNRPISPHFLWWGYGIGCGALLADQALAKAERHGSCS